MLIFSRRKSLITETHLLQDNITQPINNVEDLALIDKQEDPIYVLVRFSVQICSDL